MTGDGYPEEDELAKLREWPAEDFDGAMRFLAERWNWDHYIREVAPGVWTVSTGGWSGHEDMIAALEESWVWGLHWRNHRRGGHYVLASRDADDDAVDRAACLCDGCKERP